MSEPANSLDDVLNQSLGGDGATAWRLSRLVAAHHPGRAILDGVSGPFDLMWYAHEGQCEAVLAPGVHAQMATSWTRAHGLSNGPVNAVYDVRWRGHSLRVVLARWREGYERSSACVVIAETESVARQFVETASAFCNEPRRAILTFNGECWSNSHELWQAVQGATFDDLVLAGNLKEQIVADFTAFLGARASYERYGVPYRRGVLFLGPPGNGKTHCLRALIRFLSVPCLYVMSLKSRYGTEQAAIENVFRRAREITPCCLVFEDLDGMIHNENRSFFLNQLDGIGLLSGVLTIATTNHPERLDPSILDRPSRFDRKYHFGLPAAAERAAFLAQWNDRLVSEMRVNVADVGRLVEGTGGFSYAYLKELYVSSMMRWMVDQKPGAMAAILAEQLETLRAQMRTGVAAAASPPVASEPNGPRAAVALIAKYFSARHT
jgi:hypothetical protein